MPDEIFSLCFPLLFIDVSMVRILCKIFYTFDFNIFTFIHICLKKIYSIILGVCLKNGVVLYVSFYNWLFSCNTSWNLVMLLQMNVINSSELLCLVIWIYRNLFNYSAFDGHLGCPDFSLLDAMLQWILACLSPSHVVISLDKTPESLGRMCICLAIIDAIDYPSEWLSLFSSILWNVTCISF